jgi:hypothetical protein
MFLRNVSIHLRGYHNRGIIDFQTSLMRHGQHGKQSVQQFFCYFMFIRCLGNVFIEPLPSNGISFGSTIPAC